MRTTMIGMVLLTALGLLGCEGQTPPAAKPPQGGSAAGGPPTPNREAPAPTTSGESAASKSATEGSATDSPGGELVLDDLTLTVPAGWPSKPGASQFVSAEYVLPKAEGDNADGRLTVSSAGGSNKDNIDRWKSQFVGKPEQESQSEITAGGFTITVVELSGEFNDQRGPFAPATKRPGYRMWSAIIPVGDNKSWFIKATGPQKTIAAHVENLKAFASSAKKK